MTRSERPTNIGYSGFFTKFISTGRIKSMAGDRALNGLGWPLKNFKYRSKSFVQTDFLGTKI